MRSCEDKHKCRSVSFGTLGDKKQHVHLKTSLSERHFSNTTRRKNLELDLRPNRDNAGRIDAPVALIIMVLDVEEIDGLGHARQAVQLL
jgi:hypothetical protein